MKVVTVLGNVGHCASIGFNILVHYRVTRTPRVATIFESFLKISSYRLPFSGSKTYNNIDEETGIRVTTV